MSQMMSHWDRVEAAEASAARRHAPSASDRGIDFVRSLTDAARDNPIPAALIAAGALWLAMGGAGVSIFGGRREGFMAPLRNLGSAGSDMAGGMASSGSSVAGSAVEMARNAAGAVGGVVSGMAGHAANTGSAAYEATGSAASGLARSMQQTGAEWSRSTQKTLAEVFEQQPLLLGAVGLAVGAAMAAAMPTTELEKDMMGAASGNVMEKLQDVASQTAGQALATAERAFDAAEEQGLNLSSARDAVRSMGEKVVGIATGARDDAMRSASSQSSGAQGSGAQSSSAQEGGKI